jgi:hypothetical protein
MTRYGYGDAGHEFDPDGRGICRKRSGGYCNGTRSDSMHEPRPSVTQRANGIGDRAMTDETGFAVYAEGLNVFGRSDVPIVRLPTYEQAVTWATERAEWGRTWLIRNPDGGEAARVTTSGTDEYMVPA